MHAIVSDFLGRDTFVTNKKNVAKNTVLLGFHLNMLKYNVEVQNLTKK